MEDKPEITLKDVALYILLMPWLLLLRGWVASRLWDWFVATPFDWPMIGAYHWVGLVAFYTMLRVRLDKPRDDSTIRIAVQSVVISLFSLGIGAAAHALM